MQQIRRYFIEDQKRAKLHRQVCKGWNFCSLQDENGSFEIHYQGGGQKPVSVQLSCREDGWMAIVSPTSQLRSRSKRRRRRFKPLMPFQDPWFKTLPSDAVLFLSLRLHFHNLMRDPSIIVYFNFPPSAHNNGHSRWSPHQNRYTLADCYMIIEVIWPTLFLFFHLSELLLYPLLPIISINSTSLPATRFCTMHKHLVSLIIQKSFFFRDIPQFTAIPVWSFLFEWLKVCIFPRMDY